MNNLEISVQIKIDFFQEGDLVVASIPALQLSSQGETREEAEKNIQEVLEIFLEENNSKEKLSAVLSDCGWQKSVTSFIPPREIGSFYQDLKIPQLA